MPSSSLAACVLAFAVPQDWRGELDVQPSTVAISPAGDIWLGGRDGRVFVSRDWNRSWIEVELPPRAATDGAGITLRFFDTVHAFLAQRVGVWDDLLRTSDG